MKDTKVSVVIPLYNSEKYILRSIKSIQYQNITNIEIILVDDCSYDNTINLVEKIQSKDRRIKIIKNKKNMGILYSRSIGVLSSKGRYLFTLDNDDLFLDKDIFHISLLIGEKENFDIVEFKAISNLIKNNDLLNNTIIDAKMSHSLQFILFQPKLGMFPISTENFTRNYKVNDIYLWGKCIKAKIYKIALNKLGTNRYSRFMIRYEDILINYIIFNIAESFIFIPKYGLYHVNRLGSGSLLGKKKVSDNINKLYLIDIVIDFSLNNVNNKKIAAHLIIKYLKLTGLKEILTSNKYNMELFIYCIKRILDSKYISQKHKNEIEKIVKQMKFIKYYKPDKILFI